MAIKPELNKIAEGREAEIYEWAPGQVLRLFRDVRRTAALDHEMAAMNAVRSVAALVPRVYGPTTVVGRPRIIMERIDGPDLLAVIAKKPWSVWRTGQISGAVHAQLHAISAPPSIEPLRDRARRQLPASGLVPDDVMVWG